MKQLADDSSGTVPPSGEILRLRDGDSITSSSTHSQLGYRTTTKTQIRPLRDGEDPRVRTVVHIHHHANIMDSGSSSPPGLPSPSVASLPRDHGNRESVPPLSSSSIDL